MSQFGNEISFVTKIIVLGVFDFRAFLNIAMLLAESARARLLRQMILDIVIDTINQRDEDFLLASFHEENYRKEFTDALRNYVDMGNFMINIFLNKISILRFICRMYDIIDSFSDKIIFFDGVGTPLEWCWKPVGIPLEWGWVF